MITKYPLQLLPLTFAIYYFDSQKLDGDQDAGMNSPFFILKEGERSTVVAKEGSILNSDSVESGYRALKIQGPIPFYEYGVLYSYLALLAKEKISVLVHSTFYHDYIFIKEECLPQVLLLLNTFLVKDIAQI